MPRKRPKLLSLLVNRPLLVLLFFGVALAFLAWQSTRFEINASADTLLTKGNELYLKSKVISERFSPEEFILIAYRPDDGDALTDETFTVIRQVSEAIRRIERVDTVRSILNVPLPTLLQGGLPPDLDLESITLEELDFSFSELSQSLEGHPVYENLLVNESQTALALQVTFKPNPPLEELDSRITSIESNLLERDLTQDESDELKRLRKRADSLSKDLNAVRNEEEDTIREILADYADDGEFYLGGAQVLANELIAIIESDLIVFGVAIAAIVSLVLFTLFRELRWVFVPVVCCACSVVMTIGLFGFLGLEATVISANFVALQLILTLAIVIHLIVQYRQFQSVEENTSHRELVLRTLQEKAAPCLYAGITTSVGFATLLLSGLQPVISFGAMMIVAVFVSIVTSLALFPCLLSLSNRKGKAKDRRLATGMLKALQQLSLSAPKTVVVSTMVIGALSIVGALRLDVENSFIDYFRESTRVHKELSFIDQEFGGTTPLDLVYTIPESQREPDLVITADTISLLNRIQDSLQPLTGIGKILSLVNVAELAKSANEGKPLTEYEVTAFYRTVDASLRENLLGSYFSNENNQVRFNIRVQDSTDGLDRDRLIDQIHANLNHLGVSKANYTLSGLFVLYQDILQRLFQSQILTLGIVFVALSVAFLLIFRSIRYALIAVVPNILTSLLVLGVMGWLGIPLDLMTITIAAVAMGIAVDDTIHYIHRFREERAKSGPSKAVANTHQSVGYAIVYTTIVIVIGFSILAFSDFVPSILFGLLSGLAMAAALLLDLTILATLLRRFGATNRYANSN